MKDIWSESLNKSHNGFFAQEVFEATKKPEQADRASSHCEEILTYLCDVLLDIYSYC